MSTYLLVGLISFLLTAGLVPLLAGWARRRNLFLPTIRERDLHQTPTPRVGGLAIVVSFLLVVAGIIYWQPDLLSFTDQTYWGIDSNLLGLLLGVILLAIVNLVDDFRGLPWQVRLLAQITAATLVAAFGVRIQWLSDPTGGKIFLGGLDWLFVVIWIVGLVNVTNWLDGVNGLAGGVSAIALAILFFLSTSAAVSQTENALLIAVAFGAIVGFLPYNFGRATAFLGDTGSMFLGFIIAVAAIISGGKIATAFLVLAIPFLDALVVVFSRVFHHQSPFQADQRHLHHRFLALGLKSYQVVLLFYATSLGFGLIALNTQTLGKVWATVLALAIMAIFVLVYSFSRGMRKDDGQN